MKYTLAVFKLSALHHTVWRGVTLVSVLGYFTFNIYIVSDGAGLKNTRSVGIFKLDKEGEGQGRRLQLEPWRRGPAGVSRLLLQNITPVQQGWPSAVAVLHCPVTGAHAPRAPG